jgi:hypothetical protein
MDLAGIFASFGLPVDCGVLTGGVGLTEFSPDGAALVEKGFFILRQFVTRLSLLRFGLVHSRRSPVPSVPVAWRCIRSAHRRGGTVPAFPCPADHLR